MLPRTWDKATLLKSVGWLKYQNSQGRNIYIRPKGEHALSLVDDLNAAALDRMKSEGFQPAIVVETSPGNFQAWLNHGRVLPRTESTAAARALAERFGGDRGAADWRHFGRLAGPDQPEAEVLAPTVLPVRTTGRGQRPIIPTTATHSGWGCCRTRAPGKRSRAANADTRQIDAGKLSSNRCLRANPVYGGDNTRVDLAYAVYALAHGAHEDEVRAALRTQISATRGLKGGNLNTSTEP